MITLKLYKIWAPKTWKLHVIYKNIYEMFSLSLLFLYIFGLFLIHLVFS